MNWAIDENIVAVANDLARIDRGDQPQCPQADDACRLACITFLAGTLKGGTVLMDSGDIVFGYYRRKATMAGQPGSGDAFLKALFEVMYDPARVTRVDLPVGPTFGLPAAFATSGFDPDDFIYVALSWAQPNSSVVNAVDSDYQIHTADLAALPVAVTELCEHCLVNVPG